MGVPYTALTSALESQSVRNHIIIIITNTPFPPTGAWTTHWKCVQTAGRVGRDMSQPAAYITVVEKKSCTRGRLMYKITENGRFRVQKMGLWTSESKNGDHFYWQNYPQNGVLDTCFQTLLFITLFTYGFLTFLVNYDLFVADTFCLTSGKVRLGL